MLDFVSVCSGDCCDYYPSHSHFCCSLLQTIVGRMRVCYCDWGLGIAIVIVSDAAAARLKHNNLLISYSATPQRRHRSSNSLSLSLFVLLSLSVCLSLRSPLSLFIHNVNTDEKLLNHCNTKPTKAIAYSSSMRKEVRRHCHDLRCANIENTIRLCESIDMPSSTYNTYIHTYIHTYFPVHTRTSVHILEECF